jgi:hypothetical protein
MITRWSCIERPYLEPYWSQGGNAAGIQAHLAPRLFGTVQSSEARTPGASAAIRGKFPSPIDVLIMITVYLFKSRNASAGIAERELNISSRLSRQH